MADSEVVRHRPLTFLLIIATAIALLIATIFAVLASSTDVARDTLFPNGVGRPYSRTYPNEITPSSWTFLIWIPIFLLQISWVIYVHTLLCRKNKDTKDYLYYDPPFLPPTFYAIFILACSLTVVWLFAWDNDFVTASFVALFATCMSLCICLFFSMYFLWVYADRIPLVDMWVNIILLQNGLGVFATWTVVATLINFNDLLVVDTTVISKEDSGTICLSLLLAFFLLYVCFDVFLSKKRLRYFFAPYVTLIFSLSGVVDNNWDPDLRNGQFGVAVLAVIIIGTVAKVVAYVYRVIQDPLPIEQKCTSQ